MLVVLILVLNLQFWYVMYSLQPLDLYVQAILANMVNAQTMETSIDVNVRQVGKEQIVTVVRVNYNVVDRTL